jgi:serine/threonine protein kinase
VKVKVADLGVAAQLSNGRTEKLTEPHGTPYFMAPEILEGHQYDMKADMWSLGVCIYEALFGRAPFEGGSFQDL